MNFTNMLITEDTSAIDVLQKLDNTSRKVLFVVRDGKLVDIPFKKCTLFGILVHPYPV